MDEARIREALVDHWRFEGREYDRSHDIYHEDATLEFPQSGERFIGRDAFLTWRKRYPAQLDFRIRRVTGGGSLWVCENLISYDGGPWKFTVSILQFRGDRVATEYLYVMDGFPPAPWRAPWASPFDPLASVAPGDWRADRPFGLAAEAP